MFDKFSNMSVVCIAVESDGYHIKNLMDNGFDVVMPKDIERVPTVPFYHSAWYYSGEKVRPIVEELAQVIEEQYGRINRVRAMITCPTDAFVVDIRMLEDTFEIAGIEPDRCKLISKTALLAINGLNDYVAISVSERLISIELYINGEIDDKSVKYYEKNSVDMQEIMRYAQSISRNARAQIYLFDACNELSALSNIGRIVGNDEVMGMMERAAKVLFKLPIEQPLNADRIAKVNNSYANNNMPSVQLNDSKSMGGSRHNHSNGMMPPQQVGAMMPPQPQGRRANKQTAMHNNQHNGYNQGNSQELMYNNQMNGYNQRNNQMNGYNQRNNRNQRHTGNMHGNNQIDGYNDRGYNNQNFNGQTMNNNYQRNQRHTGNMHGNNMRNHRNNGYNNNNGRW